MFGVNFYSEHQRQVSQLTMSLSKSESEVQLLRRQVEFLRHELNKAKQKKHYKYNWKLGKAEKVR